MMPTRFLWQKGQTARVARSHSGRRNNCRLPVPYAHFTVKQLKTAIHVGVGGGVRYAENDRARGLDSVLIDLSAGGGWRPRIAFNVGYAF